MAIAPLFVATRVALVEQLRMTGAQGNDVDKIVDKATQAARIRFIDSLGASRVSTLGTIAYSENAVTANQIMRVKANQCEVLIVRVWLMRELPTLFMDASAAATEQWNEDGITRSSDSARFDSDMAQMETQIVDWLEDLTGGKTPDGGTMNVFSPQSNVTRPGASIYGHRA